MTAAIDKLIQEKPFRFDEFLARYSGDRRYELIDGEVFDLEPLCCQDSYQRIFVGNIVFVMYDR